MLKEYLELTRYKGFTVGFQYNHEDLYLKVRLTKGDNIIDCIIDYDDLSDDERIIEKIEEALSVRFMDSQEKFDELCWRDEV